MIRWTVIVLALLPCAALRAAEPDSAALEFFEKKIRPVLVQQCYECHSGGSKAIKGGLRVDSREFLRTGGDSGAAVVPGKPDESLLLDALAYKDDFFKMPPKGKLPEEVLADFRKWIETGAADPRDEAPVAEPAKSWDEIFAERRTWWSLQPVAHFEPPSVANAGWSEHPVDRFVLARLEKDGLVAPRAADPRTLIRRLSLVLTGLPPTVEQVEAFVAQCASNIAADGRLPPAVVEELVDRLLASPQFGERWARHWLDVVRFTETHGNEWNYEVHHAWQYRDYVIRAFNDDLPYNRFVREHVAGDLLPPRWNAAGFNEAPIGTAFVRFGEVNHDDCISLPQLGYDIIDNQIDTLTKAFQGTTVACARCHDHKLDAISMQDYYGLLGILRSSRLVAHTLDAPDVNAAPLVKLAGLKPAIRTEFAAAWKNEAATIARYLLAGQAKAAEKPDAAALAEGLDAARIDKWVAALKLEKQPLEEPLSLWRTLATQATADGVLDPAVWQKTAESYDQETAARRTYLAEKVETYADLRQGVPAGWQVDGQGLRGGPSPTGEFAIAEDGDAALKMVLPAGTYTHALSAKLNGALRSPVLGRGGKKLSAEVLGQRSSALRLVSNNCQLNYKNYKALIGPEWQWITFTTPDSAAPLRTYAELMTMFNNPKFPDQLSALGGDKENYRLPWEQAAANPRSYFGVRRMVWHEGDAPKLEMGYLERLWKAGAAASLSDVASRYAQGIETAIANWSAGQASDDDVAWLDWLIRRDLLPNRRDFTPRLAELIAEYRTSEQSLSLPRVAPGLAESGAGYDQPVFVRGDCTRPGEVAPRKYLKVLDTVGQAASLPGAGGGSADGHAGSVPHGGSGRLDLAERIASPANPLTARVMVNRVWHHLFGAGIVRTVDDFGHVGDQPSHPELLDYLAERFVAEGWSVKRLIRLIVLSRTFQSSHAAPPESLNDPRIVDPPNRLLWRYPARRLEAEAIRDSILAVSGRLDETPFGQSVYPFREKPNADRRLFPGPLDGNGRRSVYIKVNLMESPQFLGVFNVPGGKIVQGRRDVTNVPAQALAMLNDPFVRQQADVWATKLVADTDPSPAARLRNMFDRALSRPPTESELARFDQAANQFAELRGTPPEKFLTDAGVWSDMAHAVFNLQEFLYVP